MKQFIIKYANWKMSAISARNITESKKLELLRAVDHAVWRNNNGQASIDETMKILSEL